MNDFEGQIHPEETDDYLQYCEEEEYYRDAMTVAYNDNLDPDEQITMEERIAAYISEIPKDDFDGVFYHISEEGAGNAGREILLMVLEKFRPDLIQ